MSVETLLTAARGRGLDGVAVTDHNTMAACSEATARAPGDVLVIPAEEVDTPEGQVIGLFLDDEVEPWQSPATVIDAIHDQGGIAFAPHPFDGLRSGLETIGEHADSLDAVEIVNSRCVRAVYNDRARVFAETHGLPGLGGSDAHFAHEVGRAYTAVDVEPDRDADLESRRESVRDAIHSGAVRAVGGRGSLANHAGTKLVKLARSLR